MSDGRVRRAATTTVQLDEDRPGVTERVSSGRARRRWPWVAGAVLAVGVLAGVQLGLDARVHAREARLDAIPGVVAPVDLPIGVAWRPSGAQVAVLASGVHARGVSIGVVVHDDGSRAVVAIDDTTGVRRWSTAVSGPDALRAGAAADPQGRAGSCRGLPSGAAPASVVAVACLVTDGVQRWDVSDPPLTLRPASSARLLVLDARTGRVTTDRPVRAPRAFGVVGDLLVTVAIVPDGGATLTAVDLRTGAARWTWSSPEPVGVASAPGDALLAVFPVGDAVALSGPDGTVTLLAHDGRLLHARAGTGAWSLADAGRLLLLPAPRGAPADTLVVDPGRPDRVVGGVPVEASVDDGSLAGTVLTVGPGLRAWDAATGALRWTSGLDASTSVVVLRGRVYVVTPTGIAAVDGRSGSVVWRDVDEPGLVLDAPTSDGRYLLVVETPFSGVPPVTLVGYGLDDGRRTWAQDLPTAAIRAFAEGRALVAYAPTGPQVLRARPFVG